MIDRLSEFGEEGSFFGELEEVGFYEFLCHRVFGEFNWEKINLLINWINSNHNFKGKTLSQKSKKTLCSKCFFKGS